MRLTPAQVNLLREAENQFLGNVASRGVNYHVAMEEFVEAVLKVVLPPVGLSEGTVDGLLDRLSYRLHTMCKGRAGGTLVWAEIHAAIEETDTELAKLLEAPRDTAGQPSRQ